MKKMTLILLSSATMLIATPATDSTPALQGNGQNMGSGIGKGMQDNKMKRKKMRRKMMNSPFLIKHGLPHMNKFVMKYMNDPSFALTNDQKEKLLKVREETMNSISTIKPKVATLRKEIVEASKSGTKASELKSRVERLASLEVKATMIHLKCIESIKAILTKDQLLFMSSKKGRGMKQKRKSMSN